MNAKATRSSLTVKPEDIRKGDRFTHRGAMYEARADAEATRYSNYKIAARRLTVEEVTFDYQADVSVLRYA